MQRNGHITHQPTQTRHPSSPNYYRNNLMFREPGCTQPNQGSTKLLAWWQVAADPFPKWRRFCQSAAGCLVVFSFVAGSEEHQKPNQGQQIDTRNSELLVTAEVIGVNRNGGLVGQLLEMRALGRSLKRIVCRMMTITLGACECRLTFASLRCRVV